jgi:hypothetical protein
MTLLLICALALQDPLAIRLSPEYRATRAPVIAKELGDKAGIRLQVEPRFTNEVLILRAKDITLKELMDRIADVCDAGWVRSEEGFTLKRSPQKQRELEQLDINLRAEAIQKFLDAEAKILAKLDTPEKRARAIEQGYATAKRLQEQGSHEVMQSGAYYQPAHQFYLKTITAIGPRQIASLPIGARIDFANSPNVAQRPLPVQYNSLLAELSETAEAVRSIYDERALSDLPTYVHDEWIKPLLKPIDVQKTVFAFTNEHWGAWAYMGMYDRNGDMITHSTGFRVTFTFPAIPYQPIVKLKLVEYGPAAKELQSCVSNTGPDDLIPVDKHISQAGLELLLNPEEHDPLAYHISDAFAGLADQTGKMMIGRLHDELWRAFPLRDKLQPIDLTAFLGSASHNGLTVSERDGWLTFKLSNPAHSERIRVKRAAMGKLLRASWAAKRFDLESCCRFEYEHDAQAYFYDPLRTYRAVLISLGVKPAYAWGFFPPRLMAALGSLGGEHWRRFKAGEPLKLNTLTTIQKTAFAKVVPIASPQDGVPASEAPPKIMMHPSMSLPYGPGPDTHLLFTPDTQGAVVGFYDGIAGKIAIDAQRVAWNFAWKSQELATTDFSVLAPRTMNYGTRRGYKWEIQLIRGIVYGPGEVYERAEMDGKPRGWNDLPESFRSEVKRLFEKELSEIKQRSGG